MPEFPLRSVLQLNRKDIVLKIPESIPQLDQAPRSLLRSAPPDFDVGRVIVGVRGVKSLFAFELVLVWYSGPFLSRTAHGHAGPLSFDADVAHDHVL